MRERERERERTTDSLDRIFVAVRDVDRRCWDGIFLFGAKGGCIAAMILAKRCHVVFSAWQRSHGTTHHDKMQ